MEKEPVRWITVKGKHLPVYEDGTIGVGQEGIHRALVAIQNGYERIPVIVVSKRHH